MNTVKNLQNLWSDRRGVTAVEYGLIAALVAGAIVAIVSTLGTQLNTALTTISGKLPS
ncbi:MAG: Flp family type IVb pilin [Acetobacteraceae bacterium]|nr:Flp family type IVb pilin [Acetobacteraceae bacterium]